MKKSVIALSVLLAACGGGGGGGSSTVQNTATVTANKPSVGVATATGATTATTTTSREVPLPLGNPSALDSKEQATESTVVLNKFDKNKFGSENTQANALNLKSAYDQNLSGAGVKVGVVDGSYNLAHPTLAAATNMGVYDKGETDTVHSTGAALIVGGADVNGNVYGIAKGALLHLADAADGNGGISVAAANKALFAMANGGVKIINNSYGDYNLANYRHHANAYLNAPNDKSKRDSYIGQLKQLVDSGALLVFAAGNDSEVNPSMQSLFPLVETELQKGVLTVVGVNPSLSLNSASNQCGSAKDWCLAANMRMYTSNVAATSQADTEKLAASFNFGTSFAAPQVTAAAALVQEKYQWFSNDNLRQTLLTTATDIGAKGVDSVFGWGMLNIGRAVNGPAQFAFGDFKANVVGDSEFANDISGVGGLIKDGSGSLKLSGTHTYTGLTQVNAGKLSVSGSLKSQTNVAKGATYEVSGATGSVNNSGTFISDGATVNGDLKSDGVFETKLGQTTSVSGVANVGGTLRIAGVDGVVASSGKTIDVLKAQKVNGTFTTTELPTSLLLDGKAVYSQDKVQLVLSNKSAKKQAATFSQDDTTNAAVNGGAMLDNVLVSGNALNGVVASKLSALQSEKSARKLNADLSALSGSVYANGLAVNMVEQGKLISGHLWDLDGNNTAIVRGMGSSSKWRFDGATGKQKTYGTTLGVVKRLTSDIKILGAFDYLNGEWTQGFDSHKTDSYGLGLGVKYTPSTWRGFYGKAYMGGLRMKSDVLRYVMDEAHSGRVSANVYHGSVVLGHAYRKDNLWFAPEMGIRFNHVKQNGFAETGEFGLLTQGYRSRYWTSFFGLNAQYGLNTSIPVFLTGKLGIEHDNKNVFVGQGRLLNADVSQLGYWKMPRNRVNAALGATVQASERATFGVNYQFDGSNKYRNHGVNVGVKVKF